jgi:ubiquinone/menaquinone biosynthesis C-methylase UbiE
MNSFPKWTGERMVPSVLNDVAVEHLARYSFCLELVKDKIVLDAACGEGYGTNLLSNVARSVTGIDVEPSIIQHAQSKYKKQNLSFISASVLQTPFANNTFDVIVSFETIEHLEEHEEMLKEFKRILKQDGLLILSTPDKEQYSEKTHRENQFHKKELTLPAFEELIGKFFSNRMILGQQFISGSFIYPLSLKDFKDTIEYSGNFLEVKKSALLDNPVYLVALASDISLPESKSLLFNSESVFNQLKKEYESTWSYKIGRIITSPARFLKNLFS